MDDRQNVGPGLLYTFPFLPVKLLLPCALGYGTKVSFQGTIPAGASRFSANFQRGIEAKTSSVAFHFNPRLLEGPVVVRNSRTAESWGREERTLDTTEFPFAHQEDFCMVITPDEKGWQYLSGLLWVSILAKMVNGYFFWPPIYILTKRLVVVNGSPLLTYEHRLPLEDVTHLCVKGDVLIRSLHVAMALPPTKLIATIPNNLRPGDLIILKGQTPPDAQRFMVNLQCGPNDEDNLCLHVNPRFDSTTVARNTRLAGAWGHEESTGGLPLTQGDTFVLVIAALLEFYKIWVNGKHLANYDHRCSLDDVSHLVAAGDVTVSQLHVDSQPNYLSSQFDARTLNPDDVQLQVLHIDIPSSVAIPGGLVPGRLLILAAVPYGNPQRFAVNLQTGDQETVNQMALHINARWDEGPSVVLNSKIDGTWGPEVVAPVPHFPFVGGSPFHLTIGVRQNDYVITINDLPLTVFPHRCNPNDVDHVRLYGDFYVRRLLVLYD